MSEHPTSTTTEHDSDTIIRTNFVKSTSIFDLNQNNKMDKYANLFVCSLCDELVNPKKAKLMPCLHTLCATCEISADKIDDMIVCAKCKQKWKVEDITDHYLVRACYTNLIKCTSCFDNLIAEYKCMECDDFLCSICSNAHRRVKLSKHHCLTQLNKECPKTEPCSKHNANDIDRFCVTCNDLACNECQRENHSGHTMQPLEDCNLHYDKNLNGLLDKLNLLSSEVANFVKSADKHLNEVNEFENEIKERLRLLMNEIERICAEKRKPYLEMKSCTEMYSSAANQMTSFVEAAIECPNKAIVHYIKDVIQNAFSRCSELFAAANTISPNLETTLRLPKIKQIIDRLISYKETADDRVMQIVDKVGSGRDETPVGYTSNCVTPPARLSVSPSIGCSETQTASTSEMPAAGFSQQLPANNATSQQTVRQGLPTIYYLPPNVQVVRHPKHPAQTINAQAAGTPSHQQPQLTYMEMGSRLAESNTSEQNFHSYCQQNPQPQLEERSREQHQQHLPPNLEIVSNNQGVPIFFDHATKTLSNIDPRISNTLPAQLQQTPAAAIIWQQQQFSQFQQHQQPALCQQTQYQRFQQSQFQQAQQSQFQRVHKLQVHLDQQQQPLPSLAGNISNNFRCRMPSQQLPPQMPFLQAHQRLAQHAIRFPSVTLNDPSQYPSLGLPLLPNNVHVMSPPGAYVTLPPVSTLISRSPDQQDLSVNQAVSKNQPSLLKKRAKRTNSRPAKVRALDESTNFNKESTVAFQLNVATDHDSGHVSSPHARSSVSTVSGRSPSVTPKQNPDQQSNQLQPHLDFPVPPLSPKSIPLLYKCLPSVSPAGSLPILNVDNFEEILTSSDHDQSSRNSAPLVAPKNYNNEETVQISSCFPMSSRPDEGREVTTTSFDDDDDDCCVCQNGNRPLLHCTGADCFRSYHLDCHVPEYEKVPSDGFVCSLCINLADHKSIDDELRNEIRTKSIKSYLNYLSAFERKICERILLQLYCHCESLPFHTIEKEFYDIYDRNPDVKPMDLKTIKNKLRSKNYSSMEEFLKDVNQIFINCSIYHEAESENGRKGQIVGKHYFDLVQELIPRLSGFVKLTKTRQMADR